MVHPPRRSALYLPANNARAIEKARSLDADMVILDLEDAVSPEAKQEARTAALEAARTGVWGRRELIIRTNGLETPWGAADLVALSESTSNVGVLAPKVASPADLARYRAALTNGAPLWAMIETCSAILNLGAVAAAGKAAGLAGFVVGTNDLANEMRCQLDTARSAVLPALTLTVVAARAHGLVVIDGVFNDIQDQDGLRAQCMQAVALGFDGKTLIHPSQIAIANELFAPTADEIARAKAIIAAFADPANAGKGVLKVNGRMVELLHLAEANRMVDMQRAIGGQARGVSWVAS